MKPKIKDIAVAAGVSPATVSNVFNGRKGVGPAVQQHVLEVARQLGYARDAAPAGLRSCIRFVMFRKHGLIIMDTPFFSQMIEGMEQECHRSGYELIVTNISSGDADYKKRVQSIVEDETTPFILLATELDDEDIRMFENAKAPMIAMDRNCLRMGIHSITLDNLHAGYLAGDLLLSYGHRRIGYLASSRPFQNDTMRRQGLSIRLGEANLSISPDDILYVEPTMEGSFRDLNEIIPTREGPLPTAFFCMNDLVAAGANRALKENGYALPEDVSLVGMDDLPICNIISPTLSSINVDKIGFGIAAVRQLLQIIQHRQERAMLLTTSVMTISRNSVSKIISEA